MKIAKKIVLTVCGVLALIVFLSAFTTVASGQKGVVLQFGAYEGKTLEPGLHWLIPFRDSVVKLDTTVMKTEAGVTAATKDLQDVVTTVALNHQIDSSRIGDIFLSLRTEYDARVVAPTLQESVKAATAKYTAEELITKRSEVRDEIKRLLTDKLSPHHITVVDFNIVNFRFSAAFNEAIESKVTAEQSALAAKNRLEQTKYEAEQRIAQARGEAEAIKIQAQAIEQQGGANYVQLQAIAKWNGVLPTSFVPGSTIPFLNLQNK